MSLQVLAPGLLTTVQDLGRTGWRHLGVARCGALDPVSAALANRLIGNRDDLAVLEITLHGPALRLQQPSRIALCGASVTALFEDARTAESVRVPGNRPVELPAGILRIGAVHGGARTWLAVHGGFDVPGVLGSRSTDLRGGFGGFAGRALCAGDVLPVRGAASGCDAPRIPKWWIDPLADGSDHPVRYVPSSHPDALQLSVQRWKTSTRSNRQGLRFDGDAIPGQGPEEISAAVAPGTIQLPPDGQPIVLLADAQTVGGYPRLGHVISADLPRLAQLRPGDACHFQPCDAQTATRLACAARAQVARISLMIEFQLSRGIIG